MGLAFIYDASPGWKTIDRTASGLSTRRDICDIEIHNTSDPIHRGAALPEFSWHLSIRIDFIDAEPALLSLLRQAADEPANKLDDRRFVGPGLVIVLLPEWIGNCNDDHVELIQQND